MVFPTPRWIVCGSPASGKTTQCSILAQKTNAICVSAETLLLTKKIEDNSENGVEMSSISLVHRLKEDDCKKHGWILDGLPRAREEAEDLIQAGLIPQNIFHLNNSENELTSTIPTTNEFNDMMKILKESSTEVFIDSKQPIEDVTNDILNRIEFPGWLEELQSVGCLQNNPGALGDIIQIAESFPSENRSIAIHYLTSFLQNETHRVDFTDTENTVHVLNIYTQASKPTQEVIASHLAPELQAMLPFIEKLPAQALVTMAPLANEIIQESQNGSINPATAVRIHTAFFDLPQKDRTQLIRLLPPSEKELVTHVVETTEGLSPNEVENVVTMMIQSNSIQPNSSLPPPSRHDPSYGAIDIPEPLSHDVVMTKLALTATKAHGRRLFRWVQSAPKSLRVLSFVSSFLLAITALIAFLFDLFSGQFLILIINLWIIFFACLLLSIEVKITAVERHVSRSISNQFPLLGTVTGRGLFLLFVSILSMSLVVKASWQNAFLFCAGLLGMVVSLWSIGLGTIAFHQFNLLRTRIESISDLKRIFDTIDVDKTGELDIDGLKRFCHYFNWPIDTYFLETILRDLDIDNTNGLSLSDLQFWWSQAEIDTRMAIQINIKSNKIPISKIKLFNLFGGFMTILTGIIGNWITIHDSLQTFSNETIYIILNIWILFFGILYFIIEFPISWFYYITILKYFIIKNFATFLNSMIGRNLFLFFLGTFLISIYQKNNILPFLIGFYLLFLSLMNSIIYKNTKILFLKLANSIDLSNCPTIFSQGDLDGDGVWNLNELKYFCSNLNIEFNLIQWEILIDEMDRDHLGVITLEEFTTWVQIQKKGMEIV